jgi:hypothetical protein
MVRAEATGRDKEEEKKKKEEKKGKEKKRKKKKKKRKRGNKKGNVLFIFRNCGSQILFCLLLLHNEN